MTPVANDPADHIGERIGMLVPGVLGELFVMASGIA
jgi:hypothetical protein